MTFLKSTYTVLEAKSFVWICTNFGNFSFFLGRVCIFNIIIFLSHFMSKLDHSIDALLACLKGENNLCIFLRWFMTSVAHIMSKKLLGSITILLVKFHWIETTLHHFECPTRQDYIQPKNILAPACVHYLKRIGIMQISLRYLLWNVRINAAYSNIVVAVVDIQVLTCQKLSIFIF